MKQEFFYEFNCVEDGEWLSERVTFEDRMVQGFATFLEASL